MISLLQHYFCLLCLEVVNKSLIEEGGNAPLYGHRILNHTRAEGLLWYCECHFLGLYDIFIFYLRLITKNSFKSLKIIPVQVINILKHIFSKPIS